MGGVRSTASQLYFAYLLRDELAHRAISDPKVRTYTTPIYVAIFLSFLFGHFLFSFDLPFDLPSPFGPQLHVFYAPSYGPPAEYTEKNTPYGNICQKKIPPMSIFYQFRGLLCVYFMRFCGSTHQIYSQSCCRGPYDAFILCLISSASPILRVIFIVYKSICRRPRIDKARFNLYFAYQHTFLPIFIVLSSIFYHKAGHIQLFYKLHTSLGILFCLTINGWCCILCICSSLFIVHQSYFVYICGISTYLVCNYYLTEGQIDVFSTYSQLTRSILVYFISKSEI